MKKFSFNLVDEPWIPVRVGGKRELFSLEATLLRAREIERPEDSSPLVLAALHRLLLAVLHRALEGPHDATQNAQWITSGFPEERIKGYLKRFRSRFDLFDPERPFYQIAGYENKPKSIAQLAAELSSGTNKLLFDHTQEDNPPAMSPAQSARLLVARQMLAIPEGAGYSPSPVGGAALVLPTGDNLLETLCLNLVPYAPDQDDKPVWELDHPRPNHEQVILGLTHRYTWTSRLIRLVPESLDGETVVRFVHYGPACKLLEGAVFNPDPMLAYRITDEKQGTRRAVSFRKNRAFWRDFTALLPKDSPLSPQVVRVAEKVLHLIGRTTALPTMVLGATNDKAKFEFWRGELHLLPEAMSANRSEEVYSSLEDALEQAEDLGEALRRAAWVLARNLLSHGGRDPDPDDVRRRVETFPTYEVYWSSLDRAFPKLLECLTVNYRWDEVERFWKKQLLEASRRAWDLTVAAAGDDAFALRAIYSAQGLLWAAQKPLLEESA
ncbi:MAG: type I-E CRISPR-associated protein Cse1/CasA [Meiothermus sp.]|nr:type I-E CRISPR-associated protein Cse1/CasA [Meiothermus sp.]